MSRNRITAAFVGGTALLLATASQAAISITGGGPAFGPPGWDIPPAVLGGWGMTQYDNTDPFLVPFDATNTASSDLLSTHTSTFATQVSYREVGGLTGWATWSGGYTGGVYYSEGASALTLTMSPGTVGFSFFFQPNAFEEQSFSITAWDNLGAEINIVQTANGNSGATWAGIYTDGTTTVASFRILSNKDFAVGRFGYAIPTPGAIALLGVASLTGMRRRRDA